jgi:hypothetical protein
MTRMLPSVAACFGAASAWCSVLEGGYLQSKIDYGAQLVPRFAQ